MKNELPEVKKKKMIEPKRFEELAKRIQRYLEQESNYLRTNNSEDGSNNISKLHFNS